MDGPGRLRFLDPRRFRLRCVFSSLKFSLQMFKDYFGLKLSQRLYSGFKGETQPASHEADILSCPQDRKQTLVWLFKIMLRKIPQVMHQGVVWVFNIILETHHPVMKQSLSRHGFAWDMLAKFLQIGTIS